MVISGRKVGGTPSEAIRKAVGVIVISIAGKRGGPHETRNTAGCGASVVGKFQKAV